jgi:hypothetical protein
MTRRGFARAFRPMTGHGFAFTPAAPPRGLISFSFPSAFSLKGSDGALQAAS